MNVTEAIFAIKKEKEKLGAGKSIAEATRMTDVWIIAACLRNETAAAEMQWLKTGEPFSLQAEANPF